MVLGVQIHQYGSKDVPAFTKGPYSNAKPDFGYLELPFGFLRRDPRFPQFIHLEQPRDEDHRRGLISIFVWAKQPLLSDMYVKYNATDVNAERTTPNPVPSSNQLVLVPGVGKYEYGMHFMYAQPVCLDTSYNELLPVQARYSSHDLLLNI